MEPNIRFTGHETFPCRYAWLPKAFGALEAGGYEALADIEDAMVRLGVGKNMVRAIRFWVQATGIAEKGDGGALVPTSFGRALLSRGGYDPFLEDIRTLWLIHWQLSTQVQSPLFAWDFLLNRWQQPEMSRSVAVRAFRQEADRLGRRLSDVTLAQHFDVFLHTYVPTRSKKVDVLEDSLDCPLVELALIQQVGERRAGASGSREPIYAFRREEKPEITPQVFTYCLDNFWRERHPREMTLSFREVVVGIGSPGQILKLAEPDIKARLDSIETDSCGLFVYRDSAQLQQLRRNEQSQRDLLGAIYHRGGHDA